MVWESCSQLSAQRKEHNMKVVGVNLVVGDMLNLWLGKTRILKMTPYKGRLSHLFSNGASIAYLDNGMSITIDHNDMYNIVT